MDSLRAYDSLESAILTGRLKPRERMVEQELAEQLNMSRTPIREALRRLEERGLVRILPRRGAVVSDISQADVENIYAVRSTLEVLASQLAVERIGPEGMERVREMEAAHASLLIELTREHLRVARELYLAHLGRRPEPPVRAEGEGQAMTAALGKATGREGPTSPMDLRSRSE